MASQDIAQHKSFFSRICPCMQRQERRRSHSVDCLDNVNIILSRSYDTERYQNKRSRSVGDVTISGKIILDNKKRTMKFLHKKKAYLHLLTTKREDIYQSMKNGLLDYVKEIFRNSTRAFVQKHIVALVKNFNKGVQENAAICSDPSLFFKFVLILKNVCCKYTIEDDDTVTTILKNIFYEPNYILVFVSHRPLDIVYLLLRAKNARFTFSGFIFGSNWDQQFLTLFCAMFQKSHGEREIEAVMILLQFGLYPGFSNNISSLLPMDLHLYFTESFE